ncbi:class C beta-lactamase [Candidatus Regiella insecticola]|uniref:class C beta-lactamase n=1 Tax=Candidatus Regiella insecticola TaxID=138073 RepID=UPI001596D45C|nr:class C beta-lactamase [Candidatus Regiella insecticola]
MGSISKTFTAILASYAAVSNKFSLSDHVSDHLPDLAKSAFDKISLLNLATHTSGLPLFVPEKVKNKDELMDYFKQWKPPYPIGTYRVYSNLGIGLLGIITAKSLQGSYDSLLKNIILTPLGMTHTYIDVPADKMKDYAQGYTQAGSPIRMKPAVLSSEAYGLKSCTHDLVRYIQANMNEITVDRKLQDAIDNTHLVYFKAEGITQNLMWEQYHYPTDIKELFKGNAALLKDTPTTRIISNLRPTADVLINKTGSTNGFANYIAFVPSKKRGVVILANKSYPIDQRVKAGYEILAQLDKLQ